MIFRIKVMRENLSKIEFEISKRCRYNDLQQSRYYVFHLIYNTRFHMSHIYTTGIFLKMTSSLFQMGYYLLLCIVYHL